MIFGRDMWGSWLFTALGIKKGYAGGVVMLFDGMEVWRGVS